MNHTHQPEATPPAAEDSITVACTLTYPDRLIRDLMTTAAEGSINYWCEYTFVQRLPRDHPEEPLNVTKIMAKVAEGPVSCDHPDIEEAEIHAFELDAAKMRQGIARLLAPGAQIAPSTRNEVFMLGIDPEHDFDADTADAIVQFAVFGELVFG